MCPVTSLGRTQCCRDRLPTSSMSPTTPARIPTVKVEMFSRLHMIPTSDNTDTHTDTGSIICYNESCVNNTNKDLVGKLAESFHLAPAKNLTHVFISRFFSPCVSLSTLP